MNIKEQFKNDKEWYINNWDWFINGTYGEEPYKKAQEEYQEAQTMTEGRKAQALRRIVINGFTNLVKTELDCSYGHAQKTIVDVIGQPMLDNWTKYLVEYELKETLGL
jgi:hypothetical protein